MKKIILTTLLLILSQHSYAAESKFEDIPLALQQSNQQEFETLAQQYEEQSKKLLPYFNTQLANRGGDAFYVSTRLYKDEFYEHIFVGVKSFENGVYDGNIANDPAGKIDFKNGDPIQVKLEDVRDWTIINNDGTEQGNYLGKFMELYKSGLLNLFYYLNPLDGKVNNVEFIAAVNPATEQSITELVPKELIQKIQNNYEQQYLGKSTTSQEPELVYSFVKYPSWEIVVPENDLDNELETDESTNTPMAVSSLKTGNELATAMQLGKLLTEAVKAKKSLRLKKLPEYQAINAYLKTNKCPGFKYKAYKVANADAEYFYLLASKGKNVIIGRHFKAPIIGGVIKVDMFESSTNGCLNLGNPDPKAVGMMASHLKPYPNEFHVLQNLLSGTALFIGTSEEKYSIKDGVIEIL